MKNTDKLKNVRGEFKLSIFKEGFNQRKIGGIVYTVICALFTLYQMFDSFNSNKDYITHYVSNAEYGGAFKDITFCIPFFAAVFILADSLALNNFLRSGKARDFYCSTPNSVRSLWFSFTLSVLAWAAIGIGASAVAELPFILLDDIKMIGLWFAMLLGELSLAFLFCGAVMLAITLTGRIIPTLITTCGIALMPAMLWLTAASSRLTFFNLYFIPNDEITAFPDLIARYLNYTSVHLSISNVDFTCSASTIIYNLVLGAIYFAVAAIFATIRTGDAAGKAFVNKTAHFISLMIVTIDITGFISCYAVNELSDLAGVYLVHNYLALYAALLIIVFAAIAILMYWLCELLLTFNIKKSYRALKFIGVPFAVAIALAGGGYLYNNAQFSYAPAASEIESFTLVRNECLDNNLAVFRMIDTYGRLVTDETEFKDEEIINYAAGQISAFVDEFKNGSSGTISDAVDDDQYINLKLNLKNGKSITRSIKCDDTFSQKLAAAITSDSDFMSKFLELPDAKYTNLGLYVDGISDDDMLEIYECFKNEYNAMSDDKKLAYLKKEILGVMDDDVYYSEYDNEYSYYGDDDEYYANTEVSDSDTDVSFSYEAQNAGEYECDGSYSSNAKLNDVIGFNLITEGYKDSKFYNSSAAFSQDYSIDFSTFPETTQLIIKLSNKNLQKFTEFPSQVNEKTSFTMSASYLDGKDEYDMYYTYMSKAMFDETHKYTNEYYEEDFDEEGLSGQTIALNQEDVNILINKLFEDAANSSEIDMSKPFAEVHVYWQENGKGKIERYTVFIQTDSPAEVLSLDM